MSDQSIGDQKRIEQQVLECRGYGLGRNATAQFLKVSTYQVDKVSKELGITWNTEHVKEANRARSEQAKTERIRLGDKFRKIANLELEALLNGETTPAERKDMITVAGIAVDKDLKLAKAFMIERKVPGGEVMHRLRAKTHLIERHLRRWTFELMEANSQGREIDEAALPSVCHLKGAGDHASRLHSWPRTVEHLAQFDTVE